MGVITNWITAIWVSLATALGLVFAFIPRLVGFLVILLIGWLVGKGLEKAVTYLLRRAGFDRLGERIGLANFERRMSMSMDPAQLLGKIVFWFVFLIFLVPAVDALGLTTISALLGVIISFIPNLFVAVIVLLLGTWVAHIVSDVVRRSTTNSNMGSSNLFASITRYSIMGFAILIALEQLRIAPDLLNILFTAVIGAVALAFGLAFGLGGRESAQRWLARGESAISGPTAGPVSTPPQAAYGQTQPAAQMTPEQPRPRQYT